MIDRNLKLIQRYALSLLLFSLLFSQPLSAQSRYSPQFFHHGFSRSSLPKDYVGDILKDGLFSWTDDRFPIKVYFKSGNDVPGYRDSFPQILANSFDQWVAASDGKLSWEEVSSPSEADIVVSWVDCPTKSNVGTEIGKTRTYTRYNAQTNSGTIMKAEMKLLTRLPDRELSDMEVKKAYLHEVGHAFGIAGHSQNPDDIMYYTVSSDHGAYLSDRDRATLAVLYEHNHRLTAGVPPHPAHPASLQPADFVNHPLSFGVVH